MGWEGVKLEGKDKSTTTTKVAFVSRWQLLGF